LAQVLSRRPAAMGSAPSRTSASSASSLGDASSGRSSPTRWLIEDESAPCAVTPPQHPDPLEEEAVRVCAPRLSEERLRQTLRRASEGDAFMGKRMDESVYTIAPQAYLVQAPRSRTRKAPELQELGLQAHRRVLTADSVETMQQVRHGW